MNIDPSVIKTKITNILIDLKEIEKFILNRIEGIGTTKASVVTGKSKQYLTDCIKGRKSISYKQVLDIAKKIIDGGSV